MSSINAACVNRPMPQEKDDEAGKGSELGFRGVDELEDGEGQQKRDTWLPEPLAAALCCGKVRAAIQQPGAPFTLFNLLISFTPVALSICAQKHPG